MVNNKDPFGENLKAKRKERKVSVPQLAEELGIPADRIYKWEKGSVPKYDDRQTVEKWMIGNWKKVPHETKEGEKKGEILDEILANLKELRGYTIAILTEQQAGAKVVIGSLERLENKPEGTLSEVADKLAIKIQESLNRLQTGK